MQGCIFPLILFNMYIEEPVKELKYKVQICVKINEVFWFADVQSFVMKRKMTFILDKAERILESYKIKLNKKKQHVLWSKLYKKNND